MPTMNEVSDEQNIESLGRTFLTIGHLQSTMRVTSFAGLPLPLSLSVAHRNSLSPTSVTGGTSGICMLIYFDGF